MDIVSLDPERHILHKASLSRVGDIAYILSTLKGTQDVESREDLYILCQLYSYNNIIEERNKVKIHRVSDLRRKRSERLRFSLEVRKNQRLTQI